MLNVGLAVSSDSILQTCIGLFGQGVSGLIWEKGILDGRLGMKGVSNTIKEGQDKTM
jgi:hypothetical protein